MRFATTIDAAPVKYYRWLRLHVDVGGTTPSITGSAFIAKRSDGV